MVEMYKDELAERDEQGLQSRREFEQLQTEMGRIQVGSIHYFVDMAGV